MVIEKVRVEQIQDICEFDAQKEGCSNDCDPYWSPSYNDPDSGGNPSYVNSFEYLWDTIYGDDCSFADNPWVWVIEFS